MNYTGRPSISGCRPVLSLYPTHRFCQYLLLIFITFTNSSLFNRAFSTNSRRPLSHCFAMPLPGLRLPASASLPLASCWPRPQQLLPVSATGGGRRRCPRGGALGRPGHFLLDAESPTWRKRAGLATEGSSFWTSAPYQAVAGLDSGALPFPGHRALLVQWKPDRHASGSPFGGAGERSETERARPLRQNKNTAIR